MPNNTPPHKSHKKRGPYKISGDRSSDAVSKPVKRASSHTHNNKMTSKSSGIRNRAIATKKTKTSSEAKQVATRTPKSAHSQSKTKENRQNTRHKGWLENKGKTEKGLEARQLATEALMNVWTEGLGSDEALTRAETTHNLTELDAEDKAFAKAIFYNVLRHYLPLEQALRPFLQRPLEDHPPVIRALLCGALAQHYKLQTEPYALVNSTVNLAKRHYESAKLSGFINGVLRNVMREQPTLSAYSPMLPGWLNRRWRKRFGADVIKRLTGWLAEPAAIDLSLKPGQSAEQLGLHGTPLPQGSFRLNNKTPDLKNLSGFNDGQWWVQDAAAALPITALGPVAGNTALDLCAAPGGKTMQLAAHGASVTAVDVAPQRMSRLNDNAQRLALNINTIVSDIMAYRDDKRYDIVILDAPCSALGTLRRHPEAAFNRAEFNGKAYSLKQSKMLYRASRYLDEKGVLLYIVCSLEPEEGIHVIENFLERNPLFERKSWPEQANLDMPEAFTAENDILTHPLAAPKVIDKTGGWDGFYAALLGYRHGLTL